MKGVTPPNIFEPCDMLNIVLRTCLNSELENKVKNHHTRICGDNREQLILICLMSLIDAMNNCRTKTHLTILDDNSETWFLDKVKELTKDISCDIISLTAQENIRKFNYSAYEQFRISSEFDSLVYVVEDDYIHESDSLNEMIAAFYYMSNRFSSDEIKIFPFDSPFLYAQYKEEPTILFYSGTRYWRTTAYTSYTFLTHSSTIKNYFEVYKTLALNYPQENEGTTINLLYKSIIKSDAPISVFSPIPSLAYHVSYAEPVSIETKKLKWKDIWDDYIIDNKEKCE